MFGTALAGSLRAETLDRVVAAVEGVAITQADVDEEYRFESFLESGRVPASLPDQTTWNQVRDRLVNQEVLAQEAAMEGADPVDPSDRAKQRLVSLRQKFASDQTFEAALRSLGLSEPQVLARLVVQERTLLQVEQQLRPLASVEQADIDSYYRNTFLPEFARKDSSTPPPLAQVETQIREILIQKKINEMLPGWLAGLKPNHRVRIINDNTP